MKASAPAENKCSNFSSGNKATLPVAQVPVVVAQVKVAPDKVDPVPAVVVQVKVAPDKAGLMPAVVAQVKVAPDKAGLVKVAKVALDRLIP